MNEIDINMLLDSRFYKEFYNKIIKTGGKKMSLSYYILTICINDLEVYVSKGFIPHLNWSIDPIKEYFNLSGSDKEVLLKLKKIKEIIHEQKLHNL